MRGCIVAVNIPSSEYSGSLQTTREFEVLFWVESIGRFLVPLFYDQTYARLTSGVWDIEVVQQENEKHQRLVQTLIDENRERFGCESDPDEFVNLRTNLSI
jgi:hypothetical protein